MSKSKLVIEYEYDFNLYGVISLSKDYKLAWLINKELGLHLCKEGLLSISGAQMHRPVLSMNQDIPHTLLQFPIITGPFIIGPQFIFDPVFDLAS